MYIFFKIYKIASSIILFAERETLQRFSDTRKNAHMCAKQREISKTAEYNYATSQAQVEMFLTKPFIFRST